jgi:hypothetical protein
MDVSNEFQFNNINRIYRLINRIYRLYILYDNNDTVLFYKDSNTNNIRDNKV